MVFTGSRCKLRGVVFDIKLKTEGERAAGERKINMEGVIFSQCRGC